MRIALVHPNLAYRGGAENVVLWMARALTTRGHDVLVATGGFDPAAWESGEWDDIDVTVLETTRLDQWRSASGLISAMARRLRRSLADCDLVVPHNSPALRWTTGAVAKLGGRRPRIVWYCEEPDAKYHWRHTLPSVVAAGESPDRYPWSAEPFGQFVSKAKRREAKPKIARQAEADREAARAADVVLGNSAFTARNAERAFERPVLPCILGHPEPSSPIQTDFDRPFVAWITATAPHKNAHGFLEAIRIAVHEMGAQDLRVRTIGLARAGLESLIREREIETNVVLESRLDEADLNDRVAGCRFLAYPTIDEPFGLVPIHAMAHGRAVLASGIGGPAETVVHQETGLHIDPLDPRDMAKGLCELWRDPALCDRLGRAGRARYQAEFTFEAFMTRFEDLALTTSR